MEVLEYQRPLIKGWLEDSQDFRPEKNSFESAQPFELPNDLRDSCGPHNLSAWIQEEAQILDYGDLSLTEPFGPLADNDQGNMASVLAYSYAAGIFSSEEIARTCRLDKVLNFLSGGKIPFQHELACFRRHHRERLTALLSNVFIRALSTTLGLHQVELSLEQKQYLLDAAMERIDIARHVDRND